MARIRLLSHDHEPLQFPLPRPREPVRVAFVAGVVVGAVAAVIGIALIVAVYNLIGG